MADFNWSNNPYVGEVMNEAFAAFDRGWALVDSTQSVFQSALEGIASQPLPEFEAAPEYTVPARSATQTVSFDDVPEIPGEPSGLDYSAPDAPNYASWEAAIDAAIADVNNRIAALGDFIPSVVVSPIAPPGAPNMSGEPDAPTVAYPSIPTAPGLVKPALPLLAAINIPNTPAIQLPTFSATAPVFEIEPPAPVGDLLEPAYTSVMLSIINTKLVDMLGGKSGLPDAVEQALFDRARGREDVLAFKQTTEAVHTWAARGFSMPPGMLVAQVNAIQEENRLKGSAVNRDVYIKAQETLIQQLNTAIASVVNLEQMMVGLHNNVQQRAFEMVKLRADQAVSVYNAMVQAFNIRMQGYATEANVYKTRVDAELARLEIYKAEIQAQSLISEINKQTIDVYRAQLDALKTDLDLYRAQIDAIKATVDVGSARVQAYRAEVDAWSAKINAERTKYDIYRTQVDAEIAKTNIIRSEADVYNTKMQSIKTTADISLKAIDGQLELARQETALFAAASEAERGRVASVADVFRTQVAAYEANLRKLTVSDERVIKNQEFGLKEYEMAWQNTLKEYELAIKKYDADMQRMIELSKLQQENARTMAQYATQIAAGAMSAVQMSVAATGSASMSTSYNESKDLN